MSARPLKKCQWPNLKGIWMGTHQTILDSNHIIDWGALTEMEMAVIMDYCNI